MADLSDKDFKTIAIKMLKEVVEKGGCGKSQENNV